MTKEPVEPVLNRGVEETRTHFERAKDNFGAAPGEVRIQTSMVECPTCNEQMIVEKTFKDPDAYHMTGSCSANTEHDIERFGYFTRESTTQ